MGTSAGRSIAKAHLLLREGDTRRLHADQRLSRFRIRQFSGARPESLGLTDAEQLHLGSSHVHAPATVVRAAPRPSVPFLELCTSKAWQF
jgi:hypothetical protein